MTNLAKVVACFHQLFHFDQGRVTRNRGVSHPETVPPSHGLELLEPRLMLSATGLLPEEEFPSDAPSVEAVAITVGDLSSEVSHEDLVMHLQFDESVGTVTTDSSPHGRDNKGSLANGAFFASNDVPLGGTVVLDGKDDYVGVKNSSNLNLGVHAKRTVAVWFKIQDVSLSDHKQVIYDEGGRKRGLNIYVHDSVLYVGGWNSPRREWTGTYLSTDAVKSDTWHHVALVLHAEAGSKQVQDNAMIAYLDGFEFGRGQGSRL